MTTSCHNLRIHCSVLCNCTTQNGDNGLPFLVCVDGHDTGKPLSKLIGQSNHLVVLNKNRRSIIINKEGSRSQVLVLFLTDLRHVLFEMEQKKR